jgi:4-amino-4-deoxy-L-arabinose transferase-like glycosyltransferase
MEVKENGVTHRRWIRCLVHADARLLLVLGVTYLSLVGDVTGSGGFSADAVRYALAGREMVERGDWTRLTIDGEPYANKPPLVFWLSAAAYSVLGFTEAAARLPSRAFGLASVALLMVLVRKRHGRRAAFWAGLVMGTWLEFQHNAQTCRLDSALTFFTLAVAGAFLRTDRLGYRPIRAAGMGALLGLAILAKGPAAIVGLAAVAAGALLAGRRRLLWRSAPLAVAAALLVAGPWYALQIYREGGAWAQALHGDLATVTSPCNTPLEALLHHGRRFFLPAALWLPGAALGGFLAVRRVRRSPKRALAEAILLSLAGILLASVLLPTNHYARHLIPSTPAYAWFAGVWLAAFFRSPRTCKALSLVLAAIIFIVFPVVHATGALQTRDKYADVRVMASIIEAEAPGSRVLPTQPSVVGKSFREGVRFYFGLSLRPFDPGDPDQPPFVLVHGAEAIAEFERAHAFRAVFRSEENALYRVR